jgi:hypothetical protein
VIRIIRSPLVVWLLAAWLSLVSSVSAWSADSTAILHIRVVEGEGTVYGVNTRATRGITVQITDETGKPVDGATVGFRLPDDGPTGTFSGGGTSEIVTTRADGLAQVWGMRWNKIPGPLQIRMTAVKDQARAGAITSQYLSDALPTKSNLLKPVSFGKQGFVAPQSGGYSPQRSHKWLYISLIAIGLIGGGVAMGLSRGGTAAAAAPAASITIIGNPSVSIGGPR